MHAFVNYYKQCSEPSKFMASCSDHRVTLIDPDLIDSIYPLDVNGHRCDCLHSLLNDPSGTLDLRNMPSLKQLPDQGKGVPDNLVDDVLDSSNPLSPNRRVDTLVERQNRFDLLNNYSNFNKQLDNENNSEKLPVGSPSSSSQPDNTGSDQPS